MMTDRQRRFIESYIPSPRDETLKDGEYYYMYDGSSRSYVRKVYIRGIFPNGDYTEYEILDARTHAVVDLGYGDPFHGVRMAELYDNRQDCKDQTHFLYDGWEDLRRIQTEETKNEDNT